VHDITDHFSIAWPRAERRWQCFIAARQKIYEYHLQTTKPRTPRDIFVQHAATSDYHHNEGSQRSPDCYGNPFEVSY